jgi:hypothetical protein
MEALGRIITAAIIGGSLYRFSVGNTSFSHLLFVDDTLIFCDALPSHLRHMHSLFLCFEAVLCLKVNLVLVGTVT